MFSPLASIFSMMARMSSTSFPCSVEDFGESPSQASVVVDACHTNIFKRQIFQFLQRLINRHLATADAKEQFTNLVLFQRPSTSNSERVIIMTDLLRALPLILRHNYKSPDSWSCDMACCPTLVTLLKSPCDLKHRLFSNA
jgi:hypothetical protein